MPPPEPYMGPLVAMVAENNVQEMVKYKIAHNILVPLLNQRARRILLFVTRRAKSTLFAYSIKRYRRKKYASSHY